MIVRLYSKNSIFNVLALVAVGLYSIAFVIWLIMMHVFRYT
jgi:hypothetical protein